MKMVKNVVSFIQLILCETKLSLYKTKRQFMSFTNIWTSRFQNIRPLYIGPLNTISTCVPLKSDFFIIHMCFLKKFHISVFKENRTVIRTGQKVCRSLQSQFPKNAIILSNTSCSEYQTGSSQPFETLAHTKSPDQVILGRACVISQVQVRAYLVVTRGGLEPPMRESKSLVLPLHYRVILQRFLAGFCD